MAAVAKIHNEGSDDGWHGRISGKGQFTPQLGRYHLYIGELEALTH